MYKRKTRKGGLGFQYGSGEDILQNSDSSFIITGKTAGNMFISKIDQYGNLIWTKIYGGNDNDFASSIDKVDDNGYIIVGSTFSYSSGSFTNSDIWLLRMDENGDTLWTRSYGDIENNEGWSVKACHDGGFVITGSTGLAQKAFLLRTDSLGNAPFTTFTSNMNYTHNYYLNVFPNPARDKITVEFNLETLSDNAHIIIYDGLGREIKVIDGEFNFGKNIFQIKTQMLEKGLYFIHLYTNNQVITKKVIIE